MSREHPGAWPLAPEGRVVVELRCAPEAAELAADQLLVLGASAVVEGPVVEGPVAGAEQASVPDTTVLVADLEPAAVERLVRWCEGIHDRIGVRTVEPDPSWVDGWRTHARAWVVGPLTVRPSWVDAPRRPGGIDIVVDPGATFGSGSHPTTRMCLTALVGLVEGGETVLDVGVGSGVLAVASLRLGAADAVGVDIDPAAAPSSRACADANGCGRRFHFEPGGLSALDGHFDIVVANLLVGTIEELGPAISGFRAPGGSLVLSGFLDHQRGRVLDAVGLGSALVRAEQVEQGWVALVL